MSGKDYPYDGQPRYPPGSNGPSPAPYYNPSYSVSQQSTPAPSYHSGPMQSGNPQYLGPPGDAHGAGHAFGSSPFDSVFDDNVYPVQSKPYGSRDDLLPQGQYPDTAYYSPGRLSPDMRPAGAEDIPLEDRAGKDVDMNDHIYDDPNGGRSRRRKKAKRVDLGQLGMIGADRKRIPWVVYTFSIVQIAVLIGELVNNGILTGSPIMIHPQFNPMIGPSSQVLINMGARFAPCMHFVQSVQGADPPGVEFLCPNATTDTQICPLKELCGFGGDVPNPIFDGKFTANEKPNQWWRFIVPIFLHAGLVHIGFNLLMQLTLGKEMEQGIGSIRFFLVYMSAGIFGFVMGGNFAAPAIASTGASGSLFGIIALTLLDLLYSWQERKNPVKELIYIILDSVISFVLGLLPGLDNFSHIGGFLMGIALGVCVLHSPNALRRRMGEDPSYSSVQSYFDTGSTSFFKNPVAFFNGRKPLWWAWWLVRVGMLIAIIVVFILLLKNFYSNDPSICSWCKYLSCIPVNGWCNLGTIPSSN